ncbi:MAG: Protein translocase subunit SecF [Pseudomonadales bacterium]|nr:Protein translocase subunit SecF [Pseudomonadales bacterium]
MQSEPGVIDFLKLRGWAAAFSGALCLAGVISLAVQGLNLGLDFTGGTVVELGFRQEVATVTVVEQLEEAGFESVSVVHFGSERDVLVRLPPSDGATVGQQVLVAVGGGEVATLKRTDVVGAQIGDELRDQGFLALMLALLLVAGYVAIRYEWKMATGAMVAIAHDVLVTVGLFSLFQWEFDLAALAAVLSLVGYSINDTIVIYDRVRENFRKLRRVDAVTVCNVSLTQTLGRTITTSALTQLVVVAMLIAGGPQLKGFSLAMFVGVIAGVYSTIYIASAFSLWLGLDRKDLLLPPREDDKTAAQSP